MAEWNRNPIEPRGYATSVLAAESILNRVFLWMALGLGLTGLVAFATASNAAVMQWLIQNQWAFWTLLIGELGLVIALSAAINRLSTSTAMGLFFLYAGLNGITFSFILLAYTGESIATTFLVTAGTFGVMATYGAVTKKDLSGWGQFLFMGLVGIIIASVVNIFLGNSTMSLVISCIGVIVFTGLTAYDVQSIKRMSAGHSGESLTRIAILGALRLYLDFINLFLMLLRLMGNRR
jgi:FtsH-binding integral membrane protein